MAIELGSAYISILPETSKIAPGVTSALGATQKEADKAGQKAGGGFMSGFGKMLKGGAVAAVAAPIAGVGFALTKGFSRLNAIDQAKAKLTGLGNSTKQVEKIMKNATKAVTGTAFGLDEAATSAAGAVAAGVKPGKDLTKNLTLVGDAATIAGIGMGEMGSIFNKVAASNKIQGDVIAQLSDAGIPIVQLLGKEMGTTAEETLELASKGKVNFATFQKAMQAGLGGAAQESGKTFTGALANAKAAMGRLGAGVISGAFAKLPSVFSGITVQIDKLGPVAKVIGEQVGTAFGSMVTAISGIDWAAVIGVAAGIFTNIKTTAENLLVPLTSIGEFALPLLVTGFGLVVAAVSGITTGLAAATTYLTEHETTAKILGGILLAVLAPAFVAMAVTSVTAWTTARVAAVKSSAAQVKAHYAVAAGWVKSAAAAVVAAAQHVYLWLLIKRDAVVAAAKAIQSQVLLAAAYVRSAAQSAAAWVASTATTMASWALAKGRAVVTAAATATAWVAAQARVIAANVRSAASFVAAAAGQVAYKVGILAVSAATKIWAAGQWLLNAAMTANPIGLIVAAIAALVVGLVIAYKKSETFRNIVNGAWTAIKTAAVVVFNFLTGFISGVWNGIKTTFSTVLGVIKTVVTTYFNVYKTVISTVFNAIKAVVSRVWGAIKGIISGAISAIKSVIGGISAVVGVVSGAFQRAYQAVTKKIGETVSFVAGLPGKVLGVLGDLGGYLKDSGTALIQGFWNGISSKFDEVKGWVSGKLSDLRGLFPFSPAKEGPFSGKGYTTHSGRALMTDFGRGIAGAAGVAAGHAARGLAAVGKKMSKGSKSVTESALWSVTKVTGKGISKGSRAKLANIGVELMGALRDGFTVGLKDTEKTLKDVNAKVEQFMKTKYPAIAAKKGKKGEPGRAGRSTDYAAAAAKRVSDQLKSQQGALRLNAAAQDLITAKLKTQRDLLASMQEMSSGLTTNLRGELDLTAGITEPNEFGFGGGTTAFESVQGAVRAVAARATAFAGKLSGLAKAGIPKGMIQEVAGLGSQNGIAVADAILSGSQTQVDALKIDWSSFEMGTKAAGDALAGAWFGVGVEAQDGIVKGLESQEAALDAAAKRIARKLTKSLKKALGIHSPSRYLARDIGVPSGQGVGVGAIDGLDEMQGTVNRRVQQLMTVPTIPDITPGGVNGVDGGVADPMAQMMDAITGALSGLVINSNVNIGDREALKIMRAAEAGAEVFA